MCEFGNRSPRTWSDHDARPTAPGQRPRVLRPNRATIAAVTKPRVAKITVAGIVAGLGFAVWRAYRSRMGEPRSDTTWEAAPFPFPPIPRPRVTPAPATRDDTGPQTPAPVAEA